MREIGPPGMAAPADAAAVDAAGRLLMPGLVNAHTHGHNNLAKSLGDRWTLELLLNAAPWLTGGRTLEDKHLSTLIGAVEMVRKGCTAGLRSELRASRADCRRIGGDRTGLRGRGNARGGGPDDGRPHVPPGDSGLARRAPRRPPARGGGDLARTLRDQSRCLGAGAGGMAVRRGPGAARPRPDHSPPLQRGVSCGPRGGSPPSTRRGSIPISRNRRCRPSPGCASTGRTQTAWLDSLGVLGPRFTAAHAVWLDRDDMRRLGDAGASVAHNPGSNARLGNGLAAARALLDAGVRVGIGTDACTCSDNLNMFEAMRIASMVSRVQEHDYERWLATGEVLDMATRGSAGVLGFGDRIGALEPGRKADVVFLDLGHVNYAPLNDPVNQIVHGEDGTGVESVMIGGRMVLEGRRMVTVDEAKLARDAAAAAERLAAVTADTRAMVERLEAAVGRYAVAWSREDYHIERHARCTT